MQTHKVKKLTKIIASIGPASSGENYPKIFKAGADIFRLNFSHDTSDVQVAKFKDACKQEKELGYRVTKFGDMQGPKHRIGVFKNDQKFTLKAGQEFKLDSSDEPGDETRVKLPHPKIFKSLTEDAIVLINDGQIKLKVTKVGKDYVITKVLVGGQISSRKGFNLPTVLIQESCITKKDKEDIEVALKAGLKMIVISFVQTPEDVRDAQKLIAGRAKIIAKLEKPLAMDYLAEIVSLSDGIMIGRGDFAVEANYEIVPVYQKRIIRECNKQNKPVIVATQMLESMIQNPFPTRAEISDISTAVYDCADCVMLSAETTVGKYADNAVRMMRDVIITAESPKNRDVLDSYVEFNRQFTNDETELLNKAQSLIKNGAKAFVLMNPSMEFVGRISKLRLNIPFFPVFKDEQDEQLARLYYGCEPIWSSNTDIKKFKKEIAERQEIDVEKVVVLEE